MYVRIMIALFVWLAGTAISCPPVQAASTFAHPYFEERWRAGEAVLPNFWGPPATARDGELRRYVYFPNPMSSELQTQEMQLVQYFDKGDMVFDGRSVNSTSLVFELITGQYMVGNISIQQCPRASIAIAGDLDARNLTYFSVGGRYPDRFASTQRQIGRYPPEFYDAAGNLRRDDPLLPLFEYTEYVLATTNHNIPKVFAYYRALVNRFQPQSTDSPATVPPTMYGGDMIGSPLSEPFAETVYLNGVPQPIWIQIFTRRVLTYNPANPDPFKVEMNNAGQHHYLWRNGPDCRR